MGKAQDIITGTLKGKRLTQAELARSMREDPRYLNQQLKRAKDMKVDRFTDVMEHLGYEVSVEECGYRKVSAEYGKVIAEAGEPCGLFWYQDGERFFVIQNGPEKSEVLTFDSAQEMKEWLKEAKERTLE